MNSEAIKDHWDRIYASRDTNELGWYEQPTRSFFFINNLKINKDEKILDIGTGSSMLIDELLAAGYKKIIASDISETALINLKNRIGEKRAAKVKWIVDDVLNPSTLNKLDDISLWHDRTLLHFLLDQNEQRAYLELMNLIVRPGGFVIIAVFSLDGAERCSGLKVKRYDHQMLCQFLGERYEPLDHFDHLYYMPSGEQRPFVYALFRKTE